MFIAGQGSGLPEKEKHMVKALELLRAEEERRDLEIRRIREIVRTIYAVGGDTKLCVRRSEVYAQVAEALGVRVQRPEWLRLVRATVIGMGADVAAAAGVGLFVGMRRHGVPVSRAREQSTELRRSATGRVRRVRRVMDVRQDYASRLKEEGMPPELERLGGGNVEALNPAQADTARAEIYDARQSKVEEALLQLDRMRRVLALTAEGMSINEVAAATGMHRSSVDRLLRRARRDIPAGGEDEE